MRRRHTLAILLCAPALAACDHSRTYEEPPSAAPAPVTTPSSYGEPTVETVPASETTQNYYFYDGDDEDHVYYYDSANPDVVYYSPIYVDHDNYFYVERRGNVERHVFFDHHAARERRFDRDAHDRDRVLGEARARETHQREQWQHDNWHPHVPAQQPRAPQRPAQPQRPPEPPRPPRK